MPPQEPTENIHIYDHPESRIAFLETALADQQWRATIYPSALEGERNPSAIRDVLQHHGYVVEDSRDRFGNPTLSVLHLPENSSLRENVRTLGLARGVEHTLGHMSAEKLFDKIKKSVHYVIDDKAHLYSAFYLVGDTLLTFCGADNKTSGAKSSFTEKLKTLREPENALQSLSGLCSTFNSLIAMVYAQEGNSRDYKHMKEQFYSAMIHGKDPTDPASWASPEEHHGPVANANRWIEDHPIPAAATAQIASQLLLMASGGMRWQNALPELKELQRTRPSEAVMCEREKALGKLVRGSKRDIARGVVSTLGWLAMLYPAHKVGKKEAWNNPKRAWQEFQEHPERFASILTGGASVVGVMGGRDKDNFSQSAGEISLILGDATIFFTEISEYGGKPTLEKLAKNAAKFISESPALFDDEQRASFVQRVAHYLSGHMAARDAHWNLEANAPKLVEAIAKDLQPLPNRLHDAAQELASLVATIPAAQRKSAVGALCEALCAIPGVYVGKECLEKQVSDRLATVSPPSPDTPLSMRAAAPHVAALITHVPTLAIAGNAMRLYDVLTQFAAASPRDAIYLSHAMKEEIGKHTGLDPRQLAQAEKDAAAQHRTLH